MSQNYNDFGLKQFPTPTTTIVARRNKPPAKKAASKKNVYENDVWVQVKLDDGELQIEDFDNGGVGSQDSDCVWVKLHLRMPASLFDPSVATVLIDMTEPPDDGKIIAELQDLKGELA